MLDFKLIKIDFFIRQELLSTYNVYYQYIIPFVEVLKCMQAEHSCLYNGFNVCINAAAHAIGISFL